VNLLVIKILKAWKFQDFYVKSQNDKTVNEYLGGGCVGSLAFTCNAEKVRSLSLTVTGGGGSSVVNFTNNSQAIFLVISMRNIYT
jgi:hypothetical protein